MLRILVISLFVANLLLLGFQSSKPDPTPEPAITSSVTKDSGIPTIHLFSEMMEDQDLLSGNRQCFTLGPFHQSEDKDETRLLLQDVSTRISERQTEAMVEKGYWVFMPPYASLLEANQELISLQALGLDDIGIIYDGEWKHAISLGYFLRQENALGRKKALEEKGYEPLIRVQRQSEPRYWLDYEQNPGAGRLALDMQDRPNDFMQRSVPCPEEELFEITDALSPQPAEDIAQLQTPAVEIDAVETAAEGAVEDSTEQVAGTDGQVPTVNQAEQAADNDPQEPVEDQSAQEAEARPVETVEDQPAEDQSGQAAETQAEDVVEDQPERAAETQSEQPVDDQSGQAVEARADEAIEDQSDQETETQPEETVEDQPGQAVGTGPEIGVGNKPEQSTGTEADSNDESGTGEG